jgi:hypothetical protein
MKHYIAYYESAEKIETAEFLAHNIIEAKKYAQRYKRQMKYGKKYKTIVNAKK